ncbi:Protein Y53F4B.12, partial [Aphelenchoides avenae]
MWLTRLSERCQHRQRLDEAHLFHSEWNRRLGLCSLIGIGGSLCLSTTFFFILPHAFATAESRSVPLLPLAFAVALQLLAAYQLSTIAKQIPRNCLLYNFAYATHSECLAFAVAWSQLFDGLCFMAVLAHCLSDHV